MEDRKIIIINNIFLFVSIIYLLCSFTFFFNIYSEGLILGIGTRLYLVGFIIFAICNIRNKKRDVGIKIFSILATISAVVTITQYMYIMFYNITYTYSYPKFTEIVLILFNSMQKALLAILLIFNMKEKKKNVIAYILLIVNFILDIILIFKNITIENCLLIVTNIYITVYMLYFNKGISTKSFRNIIILIITVVLIIVLFILSVTWLPKLKYNNVVKKMQKINSVTTNVSTTTNSIRYDNKRRTISYSVSENVEGITNNRILSGYNYNDMLIIISSEELDSEQISTMNMEAENFSVNNRIFYIIPSASYDSMKIYTNIKDNVYCSIAISFQKRVSLSEKDLQNLKPFFYIVQK